MKRPWVSLGGTVSLPAEVRTQPSVKQTSEAARGRRGGPAALSSAHPSCSFSPGLGPHLTFCPPDCTARALGLSERGRRQRGRAQGKQGGLQGWEPAWASPAPDTQQGGPPAGYQTDSEGTLTSRNWKNNIGTKLQTPNLDFKTRGGGGRCGEDMSTAGFHQSFLTKETRVLLWPPAP